MIAEEYLFIKGAIESTNSKELIDIVMEHLNKIKELLMITKMIVLELQVRKETENGK